METAAELRRRGRLRVDLYPDVARKMDKIFKYVDQRRARFIAILGGNEVAAGTVTAAKCRDQDKGNGAKAEAAAFIERTQ